jgi:hypothetical protein
MYKYTLWTSPVISRSYTLVFFRETHDTNIINNELEISFKFIKCIQISVVGFSNTWIFKNKPPYIQAHRQVFIDYNRNNCYARYMSATYTTDTLYLQQLIFNK